MKDRKLAPRKLAEGRRTGEEHEKGKFLVRPTPPVPPIRFRLVKTVQGNGILAAGENSE